MLASTIKFRLLSSFEDSEFSADSWNALLAKGSSDVIFLTWHWQKTWWKVFGRGKLLIVIAERDEKPVAIASLFADSGMIYPVGSGGSDYLDLIGDVSDPEILEGMLLLAIEQVPGFLGFCFYHIPESSSTSKIFEEIARRQSWRLIEEGAQNAPVLNFRDYPQQAYNCTRKKSLLRHEAYFTRNGGIQVEHLQKSEEILPHLPAFFEQHIARWKPTPFPSLFLDPKQCLFYRSLSEISAEAQYLLFTRIIWEGRVIAYHFGFHYKGSFLWYKPSFDVDLSRHSPGEVLLRQLLLQAQHEGAHAFDFGLGDEPFKKRFATDSLTVRTWGIYPSEK